MSRNILYAYGMGQNPNILKIFREQLELRGFNVNILECEYDNGTFNPENLKNINNSNSKWWVGISLGASLLYYMINYVPVENKPNRITIINPFSSRETLSIERNFDISNQWNFSPKNNLCTINTIDLVSSIYDDKIPMYHGIELLNGTNANDKNLIYVNANHTIDDISAQMELANILVNINERNIGFEKYNYCNIYKQHGNF